MFDMRKHAAEDAGYQLRITYNAEHDDYTVTGLIVLREERNAQYDFDQDGAALRFKTMNEAMAYIMNEDKSDDDQKMEDVIMDLISGKLEMP